MNASRSIPVVPPAEIGIWLEFGSNYSYLSVMRENFVRDRDIDAPEVVGRVLRDLDLDAEAVLAAAGCAKSKARLRQQTEDALALRLFGAPMFRVGSELFWGDDRLDEALAAAHGERR